jgi:hypothetical protein
MSAGNEDTRTQVVDAQVRVQIDAFPPEALVHLHREEDVEVSGWAAALAGVA